MSVLTTVASKVLITELSKRILDSLDVGNKAKAVFSKLKVDKIANSYSEKTISRVLRFKTLTSKGAICYLDEVYYPLKIGQINNFHIESEYNHAESFLIKDGVRLIEDNCIVISGKAGQGKTTIMRKLFIEELKYSDRFPFFITLRDQDYSGAVNAAELLRNHLCDHGVECNFGEAEALLKSNKIVVFLDGFDEITKSDRKKALKLIDSLHLTYNCPSIVTTRPDTELDNFVNASHYAVMDLSANDIYGIIDKLVSNEESKAPMLSVIKNNNSLRETIRTPILVSIFILTYPSLKNEPQSVADFYDTLFHALIYQHDASKAFIRKKESNLDNKILEECFSFFSLTTYMKGQGTFSNKELCDNFHETCVNLGISERYTGVMDDIVNGTNLLTLEGHDRYVYIHRSIQEYFSAKCIQSFDEESKELAYKELMSNDFYSKSINILKMLALTDTQYLSRFYILPRLGMTSDSLTELVAQPKDIILETLKKIEVGSIGEYDVETGYKLNHFRNKIINKKRFSYEEDILDKYNEVVRVITLDSGNISSAKSFFYGIVHERSNEIMHGINNKYPELNILENYKLNISQKNGFFIDSDYWFEFLTEEEFDSIYLEYLEEVETINKYLRRNLFMKKNSSATMLAILKAKKKAN